LPSGTGLDLCMSAHAEQNAIARLRQVDEADTLYCTTAPCISCTKLALCTGIKRIVADQDYATSGKELWVLAGRVWSQYAD
jgi:dCMP deaminase